MTLTKQDIADGWKLCFEGWRDQIEPGTVVDIVTRRGKQMASYVEDFFGIDAVRYRTFSPDLPTTTHVGEAVAWRWQDTTGRWCISDDKVKVGYVLKHVPVEPLGVITPTTSDAPDHVAAVLEWLEYRGVYTAGMDLSDPGAITDKLTAHEREMSLTPSPTTSDKVTVDRGVVNSVISDLTNICGEMTSHDADYHDVKTWANQALSRLSLALKGGAE